MTISTKPSNLVNKVISLYSRNGVVGGTHIVLEYVLNKLLDSHYKSLPLIENQMLFHSFPDYSDNSRVLYEYIKEHNPDSKLNVVFAVDKYNRYNELRKKGINCVWIHSIYPKDKMHRYLYYGRTSKWIFHTHGYSFLRETNDQKIISLWHGGMAYKDRGPNESHENHFTRTDNVLILGDGKICYSAMTKFYCSTPEDIDKYLPLGAPRNDLLFKHREIDFIDTHPGKKILWMPTFRASDSESISSETIISETGLPIVYTEKQMSELNSILKRYGIHMFIKLHPLQKIESILKEDASNIHFLTNADLDKQDIQLYEIINHFDALLTDYSSIAFDYLYLNKPIGFTLDDFKEYERLRGFAMDNPLDYMPGPHLYTYDDFSGFIEDISNGVDKYESERKRVMKEVGMPPGNNNCQRIVEFFKLL